MCSHAAIPFGRRRDLDIARLRRDDTRAGEIESDRTSFRREMMRIVITERSARTRLRLLHGDEAARTARSASNRPMSGMATSRSGGFRDSTPTSPERGAGNTSRPSIAKGTRNE